MNDNQDEPQAEMSIGKQGEQNEQDLQEQAEHAPQHDGEQSAMPATRQDGQATSNTQSDSASQDSSDAYATRGQAADAGNVGLGATSTLERREGASENTDIDNEQAPKPDATLDDGSEGRR